MKYELHQIVYFVKDGKAYDGRIIARKYSDCVPNFDIYTDGPQHEWIDRVLNGHFTDEYIVYHDNGISQFTASNLFKTLDDLVRNVLSKFEP